MKDIEGLGLLVLVEIWVWKTEENLILQISNNQITNNKSYQNADRTEAALVAHLQPHLWLKWAEHIELFYFCYADLGTTRGGWSYAEISNPFSSTPKIK